MILLEAGASTTIPCYSEEYKVNSRKAPAIDYTCDGNPIDTLFLSIFEGELLQEEDIDREKIGPDYSIDKFIGQSFVNMTWLMSQYNLIHVEEPDDQVYNFKGVCRRTYWRKKSAAELAKIREKSFSLQVAGQEPQSQHYW